MHPHLHCIVPGGGLTNLGIWKPAKTDGKYLFPVKAMSKVFRAKYIALLRKRLIKKDLVLNQATAKALFQNSWVVYAKRPFASPKSVLEYLGRYSHKIAISNHRILKVEGDKVTFAYKNYRQNGVKKEMTLTQQEFIRRFALHILPSGFMRIRHYGILASGHKATYLAAARKSLGVLETLSLSPDSWKQIAKEKLGFDIKRCPCCHQRTMIRVSGIPPQKAPSAQIHSTQRAPPIPNSIQNPPRVEVDKVLF